MNRFFLDMDGVVVNLLMGIKMHPIAKGVDVINKNSHYDLHKMFNMGEEEFWTQFNNMEFWENLPKYSWSDELFSRLSNRFKENLFILTAPSKYATACATGKINWIKKNYPNFPIGRIILANQKYLLSNKQCLTVLLDDSIDKLTRFTENSGYGILFPQTYNREINETELNSFNRIDTPKDIEEVYEAIERF